MKILFFFSLFFSMFAGLLITGCDDEKDSHGSISAVYRGVTPDNEFIEIIIDRSGKTVTLSNYTTGEVNLGPYGYDSLDPETQAGGFTIMNYAVIGTGDPLPDNGYIMFSEVPGEAIVLGIFDEDESHFLGPVFAVAVDNGTKSQYYSTTYNLLHWIADADGPGVPDGLWGFSAFDCADSTPLDGQLWGMEYSLRHDDGYALGDASFGVSTLERDSDTGAWVDWDESNPGNFDFATALLGNYDKIIELVFGINTDPGGGGISIPQAESAAFNAEKYPGHYAAITYTYDFAGSTIDVPSPYEAVVTAEGQIQIFDFEHNPLFSGTLAPLSEGSISAIHAMSGIAASTDPDIRTASECRGLFITTSAPSVTMIVIFDPDGKYAGFYLVNNMNTEGALLDDFIAFGIAIKDENFVNP